MGFKKINGQNFHERKNERKRKIYEPKFVIKISSSKLEELFHGALKLFCTPSPSTNIL